MPEGFQRGVRKVRVASLRAWGQPRQKARLDSTRGYLCLRWFVDSATLEPVLQALHIRVL